MVTFPLEYCVACFWKIYFFPYPSFILREHFVPPAQFPEAPLWSGSRGRGRNEQSTHWGGEMVGQSTQVYSGGKHSVTKGQCGTWLDDRRTDRQVTKVPAILVSWEGSLPFPGGQRWLHWEAKVWKLASSHTTLLALFRIQANVLALQKQSFFFNLFYLQEKGQACLTCGWSSLPVT